ncbi:NlpC/P60 family protein [Paenibacillus lutrae]|uniref:Cell wall lytic activity protein n=1 Tax=Paenibacillus lutrae TaxID=2078573 RepID=A0A7X3K097_9BACL|nr:NlpC/P60 family protein [Paenibacillus lutrae]MVP00862.1 cell wall lytic activity protein [Paenibacillus lutrae]
MKIWVQSIVVSCAVVTAGLLSATDVEASSARTAKVQVNDTLVNTGSLKPFIDSSSNLMIPLRVVAEDLGAKVDWTRSGSQMSLTVNGNGHKVTFTTGEKTALVDGKKITLPSKAQFIDSTVYVPMRFLADSLNIRVQWDDKNTIAIFNEDGKYHAPAWYAPKPPVVQAATSSSSKGSTILATANKYKGVRYVYGGTTPSGFDCSGFVGYVFDKHGVDLPRSSASMYAQAGYKVSSPQPGDLVFFASNSKMQHVGIYVGSNKFISATNDGVTVDSLGSSYWGSRYVGAKRVL